jgi:hypothetical protein
MTVRLLFAILGIITVATFTTAWYMYVPVNTPQTIGINSTTQVVVTAELIPCRGPGEYRLNLKAIIPEGYHIYSINYLGGVAPATVIELDPNLAATLQSGWTETPNPDMVDSVPRPFIDAMRFSDSVEWTVDVRAFNLQNIPGIRGTVTVYPCGETGCLMPQKIRFYTGMID